MRLLAVLMTRQSIARHGGTRKGAPAATAPRCRRFGVAGSLRVVHRHELDQAQRRRAGRGRL